MAWWEREEIARGAVSKGVPPATRLVEKLMEGACDDVRAPRSERTWVGRSLAVRGWAGAGVRLVSRVVVVVGLRYGL